MLARYFMALAVLLLAGCSAADQTSDRSGTDGQKPNIIFILVDDMGWGDVGYHGSEIKTPNIDALAASGVTLDRAYAFPICSPTRAALMSGRDPLQFGVDGPMENDAMLSAELTLLPEYLRDAGYQTWLVGKWHLGMGDVSAWPQSRGFDSFYGHLGGFIDYYTHVYLGGLDWQRDGKSLREDGHSMDLETQEAIGLLSKNDGKKPFFMYLSYNAPHTPLQYPPGAEGQYTGIKNPDRRVYAQMVTHLDDSIGKVMKQLNESNLAENTIVVFMSDNGGILSAGGNNGKLRAGKGSAFEGGVRVPAIVSWPSKLKAPKVLETPFFVLDWLPTLLEATGVEYDAKSFDGISNWAAISKQADPKRSAPVILGTTKSKAVYQWPFKLVRDISRETGESTDQLFNVVADPTEANDISADNKELVEKLVGVLDKFPKKESKGNKGPPPESLFKDANGKFNLKIRMPETREPWAEAATGVASVEPNGS
jgi:arylsulfatase A-like enzyme